MLLTGKSKRAFFKWLKIRVNAKLHEIDKIDLWFILQDNSFKNTLIIEWLDSKEIIINTFAIYSIGKWNYAIKNIKESDFRFKSRQEATTEAIKKANEIYNNGKS